MNLDIQAKDIDLTGPLKEYIEEKIGGLSKYLGSLDSDAVHVRVEVARTTKHHRHGDVFYAEATMQLPGRTLRAEYTDEDARAALDKMRDILQREIRKYKTQLQA